MILVFAVIFLAILGFSLFLALKSMKGFIPEKKIPSSGVFLVRKQEAFTPEVIKKLYLFSLQKKSRFSLERLFKGRESALVLWGPLELLGSFPELDLLHLEDYADNKLLSSFVWEFAPEDKDSVLISGGFLDLINLGENQQFFLQVVFLPLPSKNDSKAFFLATLRGLVVDRDPASRIELAKNIGHRVSGSSGLRVESRDKSSGLIFEEYIKRMPQSGENKVKMDSSAVVRLLGRAS